MQYEANPGSRGIMYPLSNPPDSYEAMRLIDHGVNVLNLFHREYGQEPVCAATGGLNPKQDGEI